MSDQTENDIDRLPKGRSPSYPGISLPMAIRRARKLYDYAQQHPIPLETITSKWGYKAHTTGPATVNYSALKKYGLLTDEGTGNERVGRLTDLAVEILHENPNQQDGIRQAALRPQIHREWWEKYGNDLPPDEALRWEYVVKGPFTESGFKDFLRVFRETVAFAKLHSSVVSDREESGDEQVTEDDHDPAGNLADSPEQQRHEQERKRLPPPADGLMSYAVPVAPGTNVTIEGRFPLTEPEWAQFMAVLSAMKPALTLSSSKADSRNDASEITG
jgi:hypothetical protein